MKFTFKQNKPTGPYKSFQSMWVDIKLNKRVCGAIHEVNTIGPTVRSDEGKWYVRLMVRKVQTEKDPAPFKWITLKGRFNTHVEAQDALNRDIEHIMKKFDLYLVTGY